MKTYIRRQQHKSFKHQDIKQKEPRQKCRLRTISMVLSTDNDVLQIFYNCLHPDKLRSWHN